MIFDTQVQTKYGEYRAVVKAKNRKSAVAQLKFVASLAPDPWNNAKLVNGEYESSYGVSRLVRVESTPAGVL